MTRIFTHLVVGDAAYIPTQEELDEVLRRYKDKSKTFVHVGSLQHKSCQLPEEKVRMSLRAGDADWQPTPAEIDYLRDALDEAMNLLHPVIVTRTSVDIGYYAIP